MKTNALLLSVILLSFLLMSCTAVGVDEPNVTDSKDVSGITTIESTQEENPGETTTDDIGTTAVYTTEADTTEVGTTEADTAEPEDTTAPDENIAVIPNQSYVGKWAYTLENEGRVIEVAGLKLVIQAVNSDSVIFSYHTYKDIDLQSVKVEHQN